MRYLEFMQGPARLRSPETDFGCWWMGDHHQPKYRVSWIETTGELYAVEMRGSGGGEVEVLAVIRDEAEVERVLDGWADACGQLGSLDWVWSKTKAVSA